MIRTCRTSFVVRSGRGSVTAGGFTDHVCFASRAARYHAGWQSVRYDSRRYQLLGGIRTPLFICLNSPIG